MDKTVNRSGITNIVIIDHAIGLRMLSPYLEKCLYSAYGEKKFTYSQSPTFSSWKTILSIKLIPEFEEKIVDGRYLGFSRELKVDLFMDNRLVIDIKTGDVRDFHKYTLAGYALAIEADSEIPVDYGVISYLSVKDGFVKIRNDLYFIDDALRREFIDIRDRVFDVIELGEDPGYPTICPDYCIYYDYCSSKRLKTLGKKVDS
ncbi:MAG: type I-A CRISPR-associated protein Cas4/Csa1 [Nitrososphaeria archaeon]